MAARAPVGDWYWVELVKGEEPAHVEIDARAASINVCFSTTGKLISRTIRAFTCSPVSHAVITFRSLTLDRVMVMQASGHGFEIVPWSRWAQANILVARFRMQVDDETQLVALRAIARRLGDGYDRRGLIGFVPILWYRFVDWITARWRVLRQGRGKKTESWRPRFHNWLDNPKRLFCSEAVAEFLRFAGFDDEIEYPSDWSPKNLLDLAKAEAAKPDGRFVQIPNDENQEHTIAQQLLLPDGIWERAGIEKPTPPAAAAKSSAPA